MGKPTRRGSGQIGCLSSLLLFNYTALKHRGYLPNQLNTAEGDINSAVYHAECRQKWDS